MAVIEAIAATAQILDFTEKLRALLTAEPSRRLQLKPVIKALETIYFTPNGLVGALRKMQSGVPETQELVQAALIEFNQIEEDVHSAVRQLSFESLSDCGLTFKQRRVLEELAYGKLVLRSHLQDGLNQSLTFGEPVDQSLVDSFIAKIEALNHSIEVLEEAFH